MTPEEMEKLPKPIEKIMSNLELSVMSDVVERIKNASKITPLINSKLNRLYELGKSKKEIRQFIERALKDSDISVDNIYKTAIEMDYIQNKELYDSVGKDYLPLEENDFLKQVVEAAKNQTKDNLKPFENLTKTTGFRTRAGFTPLSKYFSDSLDKAMLGIASGNHTYSQAIEEVIDEMSSSGLRVVNYESGKTDRIEVAARRAVMTGVTQMVDKINEHNAKELGTNHWEVDWHFGARNKGVGIVNHQSWQGKVYNDKEMVTVCGCGDMLGFAGINCYHIRFPFILGVSKRKYTDEWLEDQNRKENTKIEYKNKGYDAYAALQHQRKLERTIRKRSQDVKLLEKAEVDKDTLTNAKCRLRAVKREYAEFSKAMGLRQQLERLKVPRKVPNVSIYADMKMGVNNGNITDEDRYYLNISMSFKSYLLNQKLRNQEELSADDRTIMRGIDKAILKLPEYKGTVYRSVSKDNIQDINKFESEHTEGNVVVYNGFTSTSLEVYDKDMEYQLVILSKHGKDMTSYNEMEKEVIFRRGTVFFIKKREGNNIYMEEV